MYGQGLEREKGSADFLVFLLSQVAVLTILAPLLGMPYTSSALVSAMLWVSCRKNPMQKMQVGFMGVAVEAWLVPFARAALECLQAQSGMAAIPHVLGFLSGHVYFFGSQIAPLMGLRNYFEAPAALKKAMGDTKKKKKKKGGAIKKKKKKKASLLKESAGYKLGGDSVEG